MKLSLYEMRCDAAMAVYFANTHEKRDEITSAMAKWTKHESPLEMTRKECDSMVSIACQYGFVPSFFMYSSEHKGQTK